MLSMVSAKLSEAGRYPSQAVYFFTDIQQSTWQGGPSCRGEGAGRQGTPDHQEIQEKAKAVFVDVGRDEVGNLALLDLAVDRPFITTGKEEIDIKYRGQELQQAAQEKNVKVEPQIGPGQGGPATPLRSCGPAHRYHRTSCRAIAESRDSPTRSRRPRPRAAAPC